MPIYEIRCKKCQKEGEVLVFSSKDEIKCSFCGSVEVEKLMSATSSLTGGTSGRLPGANDHGCCGQTTSQAACAGPGSCCGRAHSL